MVDFRPFKGIRFQVDTVEEYSKVVSLPYDKIDSKKLKDYQEKSPYNIVHALLPNTLSENKASDNQYQQAKETLQGWYKEKVLQQDETVGYTFYEQTYTVNNQEKKRLSLIGLAKLTPFEDGPILPHERTLKGPREDRLKHLKTTQHQIGTVFSLYDDPTNSIQKIAQKNHNQAHEWQTSIDHVKHRLWTCTNPDDIQNIQKLLSSKEFIIADGHHRYTTALQYSQAEPSLANQYILMAITNVHDEGLTLFPTHRVIKKEFLNQKINFEQILPQIKKFFKVREASKQSLVNQQCDWRQDEFLCLYPNQDSSNQSIFYIARDSQKTQEVISLLSSENLYRIDVSLLHEIILNQIFDITPQQVEEKKVLSYFRNHQQAIEASSESYAFILKGESIQSTIEVAQKHEFMPQKSTDFFPKIYSGLVMVNLAKPSFSN